MADWIGYLFLALAIGAGIAFRFLLARPWNNSQERNLSLRRAIIWWLICMALVTVAGLILIRYYQSVFGTLMQ